MRPRLVWIAFYGAIAATVPIAATVIDDGAEQAADEVAADRLRGIWSRYATEAEGDPIRFYYFHGDGHGLYRYGRVGYTNTNSFDYAVQDGVIVLKFRKTGERHLVRFSLEPDPDDSNRDWLTFESDPRESGQARYFRDRRREGPHDAEARGEDPSSPAGHMWIDRTRYATGGTGFSLYQLRGAGIDGRGTGWHHRGDFDDWSTESLVYRVTGNQLELSFPLRHERFTTTFELRQQGKTRVLWLAADPRDFWHHHELVDMGPSFGTVWLGAMP